MRQPFTLAIGLRYTRSRRRSGFVSFITLISVVGIALGITTLIVVLSVMNGFQTEVRERRWQSGRRWPRQRATTRKWLVLRPMWRRS